jgi:hypothetical protein
MRSHCQVVKRYIDPSTKRPYWHNPLTGYVSWTKPTLLLDLDSTYAVVLPDEESSMTILCSRCATTIAELECIPCHRVFCPACNAIEHRVEPQSKHRRYPIVLCSDCDTQVQWPPLSCLGGCAPVQCCPAVA